MFDCKNTVILLLALLILDLKRNYFKSFLIREKSKRRHLTPLSEGDEGGGLFISHDETGFSLAAQFMTSRSRNDWLPSLADVT